MAFIVVFGGLSGIVITSFVAEVAAGADPG